MRIFSKRACMIGVKVVAWFSLIHGLLLGIVLLVNLSNQFIRSETPYLFLFGGPTIALVEIVAGAASIRLRRWAVALLAAYYLQMGATGLFVIVAHAEDLTTLSLVNIAALAALECVPALFAGRLWSDLKP